MEEPNQLHYLKTIATLLALSHFNGQKDENALIQSSIAIQCIIKSFRIDDEVPSGTPPSKCQEIMERSTLSMLCAAKILGIYQNEPAALPDEEWLKRTKSKNPTGLSQGFSQN